MKKLLAILVFTIMSVSSAFADVSSSIYDPNHLYKEGVLIPIADSDPQGSDVKDGFLADADNLLRVNQVNPMNIAAKTSTHQQIPFSITKTSEFVAIDNFSNERIKITVSLDAINPNTQLKNLDVLTVDYRNSIVKLSNGFDGLDGFQLISVIIAPEANLQLNVNPVEHGGVTGYYTIEKVQ